MNLIGVRVRPQTLVEHTSKVCLGMSWRHGFGVWGSVALGSVSGPLPFPLWHYSPTVSQQLELSSFVPPHPDTLMSWPWNQVIMH